MNPKFFADGEIVIKNRIITPEVQEAREAKLAVDRIVTQLIEQGDKKAIDDFAEGWAQETVDGLLFPERFKAPEPDKHYFGDSTEDFLKFKKISHQRHQSYKIIFGIVHRYELYPDKPINLDEVTEDTLVSLAKFFKDEHSFFVQKKEKYRTILAPNKK